MRAWLAGAAREVVAATQAGTPAVAAVARGVASVARSWLTRKVALAGAGLVALNRLATQPGADPWTVFVVAACDALVVVGVAWAIAWEDARTGGRTLGQVREQIAAAVKAEVDRQTRGG